MRQRAIRIDQFLHHPQPRGRTTQAARAQSLANFFERRKWRSGSWHEINNV
jgi:hypothetical protein